MYTLEQLERWDSEAHNIELSNGWNSAMGSPGSLESFNFADANYSTGQPTITVAQFLKRQDLMMHRMLDIAEKGFLVDAILQPGFNAEGGVVPYTRSESLYLDRDPEEIPEGGYYPVTGDTLPAQLEERAKKYGLKVYITEETVRRSVFPMVERELVKLRNTIIRFLDTTFLARINAETSAVIPQRAATGAWAYNTATIALDIENARADIRNLYEGYEPDTLILHPSKVTALVSNTTFGAAYTGDMARSNPIFTGQLPTKMFGLDILYTPNMPASNIAFLLQRGQIGGIADEVPLEIKSLPFNEDNDSYWLKGRRVSATFLTDPKAMVKLTGI